MGTQKRERQKANRLQRQIEEARADRVSMVRRNVVRWVVVAIAAVGGVVLIAWIGGAFDSSDDGQLQTASEQFGDDTVATTLPPATSPTTAPVDESDAPASLPSVPETADPGECPATDGSEEPQQQFDEYPPFCIDVTKTYTADIATNFGDLTIELDPRRAPMTVNNFVTLARFHYFDGTECHRAIPAFVVQCGDPTATGTGGPGYRFVDELPVEGEYQVGSLAMANSGPDTNGSQFFIITGENGAALPPSYSLFGQVTDGLDTTLTTLDSKGNPENNGVPPLEQILIDTVTITES